MVGVARYVRLTDDPETAEVAVTVADYMQGRGVGKQLGVLLADEARGRGVVRFSASILTDNRPALAPDGGDVGSPRVEHRPRRERSRGRFGRLSGDPFSNPRRPARRAMFIVTALRPRRCARRAAWSGSPRSAASTRRASSRASRRRTARST